MIEHQDSIEINGQLFNKPFVEKPLSAEDHNICIYMVLKFYFRLYFFDMNNWIFNKIKKIDSEFWKI